MKTDNNKTTNPANKQEEVVVEKKKVGRQEKPDDQKSEKTIKNREAMSWGEEKRKCTNQLLR